MTEAEKSKLLRIIDTFRQNYRLTQLLSRYLNLCPELITKEMVDALTEDGTLSTSEAVVALLAEILGLDFSVSEDRVLIRDYLPKTVRILDTSPYYNDPYYKNVKIRNKRVGRFELKNESYKPYRAVICDDMQLLDGYKEISPVGFFTEEFCFPAVLEDGNEWMTLAPVDMDTCKDAIGKARGKVVTFGLGLGYFAYMAARKPEVESVTVVDISEDVLDLFRTHILPQFPNKEKIRLVCKDAYAFAEEDMAGNFDFVFADIWHDAGDGREPYLKMKQYEQRFPDIRFDFWLEDTIKCYLNEDLWDIPKA
jgi:hypothetical protein